MNVGVCACAEDKHSCVHGTAAGTPIFGEKLRELPCRNRGSGKWRGRIIEVLLYDIIMWIFTYPEWIIKSLWSPLWVVKLVSQLLLLSTRLLVSRLRPLLLLLQCKHGLYTYTIFTMCEHWITLYVGLNTVQTCNLNVCTSTVHVHTKYNSDTSQAVW